MRARRSTLITVALAATLGMTGCASGGDAGFCGPLHDDHETAADAFDPLIPGTDDADTVRTRLALVEKLEPTPELADDLEVWTDYLIGAADIIDDDPDAVLAAHDAAAAGEALSDYYTGICLR